MGLLRRKHDILPNVQRWAVGVGCTAILTPKSSAAYWIAFGPHGPRALPAPGEGWYVFRMTMLGCGIAVALYFFLQMFVRPPPRTMTKEYQQMSNEYLRVRIRQLVA